MSESFTYQVRMATAGSNMTTGIMDMVCYQDGKPLAYMVVVDGQLRSSVNYDNATRVDGYKQRMERSDYIETHKHTIIVGCTTLFERAMKK
jgi:hypothetical protein